MKTIILEGIATSGKTTLKNKVVDYLTKVSADFCLLSEETTFMPVLEDGNKELNSKYLMDVLNRAYEQKHDYYIIERCLFSFIFKTSCNIDDFKEVERLLLDKNTTIILFNIDEDKIAERVFNAMQHRDQSWVEYVMKKGDKSEIENYYINQQKTLKEYANSTNIKTITINSTSGDFQKIFDGKIKQII